MKFRGRDHAETRGHRSVGRSRGGGPPLRGPRRRRVRAGRLSRPLRLPPQRSAVRQPVEPERAAHGAGLGRQPGRDQRGDRRGARRRRGLRHGHLPVQRLARWRSARAAIRRWAASPSRSPPRRSWPGRTASSRRATSSGTTTLPVDLDGHGTHVAGTIGQLTNNGVGVAGMAFNVRLMPVKVIAGDWDFIFGAPNEATTSVVAARHPLRRRQRRQGDQHEHRLRRRRVRCRPSRRRCATPSTRARSSPWRPATTSRTATPRRRWPRSPPRWTA